jgi:hypothetical protein
VTKDLCTSLISQMRDASLCLARHAPQQPVKPGATKRHQNHRLVARNALTTPVSSIYLIVKNMPNQRIFGDNGERRRHIWHSLLVEA